jgi:crotonobetainyl-CoA:carnitine CoA-transferase CaiB-like acyl-CoA transferase
VAPPLAGIRVLDLSRLLPGPFSTQILADLGAQVDKLEDPFAGDYLRLFPPLKDGLSGRFRAINRNKRSLCLDLKQPAGRAALLRLLPRYDVLVEGFRPGVMARLGLSYEVLAQHHPRLILCSISGYGQDGPYRDRAGHDLNYLALAGVLSLSGSSPELPPHPLPIQLADLGGGGLWAATAILAALHAASQTGQGRHLDIAMCDGSLAFLMAEFGHLQAGAPLPRRGAELLTGGMACYTVYQAGCGRYVSVAALEPKFWLAFNQALGRQADAAELLAPPEEQARIKAEVQALLGQRSWAEWAPRFAAADACVEPVLDMEEVRAHPLFAARRMFSAAGLLRTPCAAGDGDGPAPQQGQHSAEILREAGISDEEIAELRRTGVTR